MEWVYKGTCWKFGDNVLNDGQISTLDSVKKMETDPQVLAKQCMAGLDPAFAGRARPKDLIVAGRNFGMGQLHMQGPLSIKGLGVGVVTESMTRSFFRLMVTAGVPMVAFCPGITGLVSTGDGLEVDFSRGSVANLTTGEVAQGEVLPPFLLEIIAAGGELAWLKTQHATQR